MNEIHMLLVYERDVICWGNIKIIKRNTEAPVQAVKNGGLEEDAVKTMGKICLCPVTRLQDKIFI
jgi:hypothetical protein